MSARIAGEALHFDRPSVPAELPETWRDLDRAVWRWVLAHGGDALSAQAAGWASHAEGQGHSAWPMGLPAVTGMPALGSEQQAALACSPWVQNGAAAEGDARPLVLDNGYLYLLRNYRAEVAVAQALVARRMAAQTPLCQLSDAALRALFNGSWREEEAQQRAAVQQALGRRLMVLTGGPGTGKTTTVLRMLLGLSREHQARTGQLPQLRIAAPTGKAAQRLSESLRKGGDYLRASAQPIGEEWRAHLAAVVSAESGTVHRLLGSRGRHGGYTFHRNEPLPADIVVVDEASMLDLGLLRALLAALREDAVLILVGDADQLTSVGTGSVMMDIVQALDADPRGDLVRLSHCFRANARLVPLHEAVRQGDPCAFQQALALASAPLHTPTEQAVAVVHAVAESEALRSRVRHWAALLQQALASVAITTAVPATAVELLTARLQVLHHQQLLCALREGPFGARQVAADIAAYLRGWGALSAWGDNAWYPGRAVIITRNDHAARLYNGDVGLCVLIEREAAPPLLQVVFEAAPDLAIVEDGMPSGSSSPVRLFAPNTLPACEDAYALTVHKSQGSEYNHVAVLLPPEPESPLLVRQMLYTALSRAKHSVELWAQNASRDKAITTTLQRHGRLAQRIQILE